ncbi:MAG: tRNA pseudouridine(38-40) synthase TruA [Clostridiales bacterium]|jgi:tRNA pseudouridine38-40 synthase|nr:tRNA pseudouridine(38-40) synthase TruA [Clostridiales bacterium]
MNILLTVAYEGTNYCGWQRQANGVSVQQRLEDTLAALTGVSVRLTGASRTDAGVHALGQRAGFKIEELKIPVEKLPRVINARLPGDIAVCKAEYVPDTFNARYDAKRKTYRYVYNNAQYPNPLLRNFSWHVPQRLDIVKMEHAAQCLIGRHDFTAFCASHGSARSHVREIYAADIKEEPDLVTLTVTGSGFLYNMVRIIAGTLMYVGTGKLMPFSSQPALWDVEKALRSRDRTLAGKTAPPQGLVLLEVTY